MTNKYKEAFEILTDWFHSYTDDNGIRVHERHITKSYEEAKKTISELVEMATPKKPIQLHDKDRHKCPNCKSQLPFRKNALKKQNPRVCCDRCGQAIDWSE